MRTLQKLKDETIANLEKTLIVPEDIDDIIDAFMDVLEANGGTLRFMPDPPPGPERSVAVGTAGEKSGTGR